MPPVATSAAYRKSLNGYARRVRAAMGLEETSIFSPFGLHALLTAYGADLKAPEARAAMAELLAMDPAEAQAHLRILYSSMPEGLKGALGAWQRGGRYDHLTTDFLPCPPKVELDRWADEATGGLIKKFPLDPDKLDEVFLLATAIALKTAWVEDLWVQTDGTLYGGKTCFAIAGVMDTVAAGTVAVLSPRSTLPYSVVSVIGAEDVSPAAVWDAVEEVTERLIAGEYPDTPEESGHAWTVEQRLQPSAIDFGVSLPKWSADENVDLVKAPGIALLAGSLDVDDKLDCRQVAVASYDEKGFAAAAITAMMVGSSANFSKSMGRFISYDLTTRPHAVTALVRGEGPWSGLRLFDAWVKPEVRSGDA